MTARTTMTWSSWWGDHVERAVSALAAGEVVVVAGGWGSGRSTLLRDVEAASGLPDLVVVDDAHLVAPVQAAAPVDALVGALVDGRPVAVAVGRQVRLDRAVRRALASRRTARVDLPSLGVLEVGAFLDHHGRPSPAPAVLRATGGVLALLGALVADQHLDDHPDPAGPRVRECVDALLDTLPSAGRTVLTTLMCTGPLPVVVADRVLTERAVDDLQTAGLLVEDGAGGSPDLRLVADLLVTGWEAWVTPRRRRALLARVVAGTSAADLDAMTLRQRVAVARWAVGGGPEDVTLVRSGLRPAVLTGALDLAASFAGHVLRHDPDDHETRQTLVMALEAAGDHAAAARWGTAEASDALSLARRATNLYLATRDAEVARSVGVDQQPPSVAQPDGQSDGPDGQPVEPPGEAAANVAWLQMLTGDVDDCCTTAEQILADPAATVQARVWACVAHAAAAVVAGRVDADAVLDLADRMIATDGEGLSPYSAFQVSWTRAVVRARSGRAAAVEAMAAREVTGPDPLQAAAWHGIAGLAARELGEVEVAAGHFDAIADVLVGDPFGLGSWALSERAVVEALTAPEVGAVPGSLEASVPDDESTGSAIGYTAALVARNRAWCAAAHGDVVRAAALSDEAARLAHQRGQSTHEVLALVDLARFGRAGAASARVAGLGQIDNALARAGGRVVDALARPTPPRLLAAATAAAAVGWYVVRAELVVAARRALVSDGRADRAAVLELLEPTRSWPTPLLGRGLTPDLLTARERELGRLAATGLASDAIAEAHGISRRTVDNLLGRVYVKCGVRGRVELREALDATGLARPT